MIKIAEEFIIRITDDFKAGISTQTGATSGGGAGGGRGGLASIGTKLGAGIAIGMKLLSMVGDVVTAILRPVRSLLNALFRMLGELLRPISEVLIIMLKPLLMIIKPLIDTFKGYMSPFMEIARSFSRMSQEQMAKGNITGAMNLAIEGIQTVVGPFIVSLTSVALQLASTLLISAVTRIIGSIVEMMGNVLQFVPVIGDDIKSAMDTTKQAIEEGGNSVLNFVNDKLNTATISILDVMLADAQNKLKKAKETYSVDMDALIEEPEGALTEFKKTIETDTNTMRSTFEEGLNQMGLNIDSEFGSNKGNAVTSFKSGLDSMVSAVRLFSSNLEAYAEDVNSINFSRGRHRTRSVEFSLLNFGFSWGE